MASTQKEVQMAEAEAPSSERGIDISVGPEAALTLALMRAQLAQMNWGEPGSGARFVGDISGSRRNARISPGVRPRRALVAGRPLQSAAVTSA